MGESIQVNLLEFVKSLLSKEQLTKIKDQLEGIEFPKVKDEKWKYTKHFPITNSSFTLADKDERSICGEEGFHNIFFVNGEFDKEKSDSDSNFAVQEGNDIKINEPFALVNAIISKKYTVTVNKLTKPIQILNIFSGRDGEASFSNLYIDCKEDSKATILERQVCLEENNSYSSPLVTLNLNKRANINYIKLQEVKGLVIDNTNISVGEEAHLSLSVISNGANLLRNNLKVEMAGRESESHINGLYLLKESRHLDNSTRIEHPVSNSNSTQTYKGIVDDSANVTFAGSIFVAKDAQQTASHQLNKTILIGDRAVMNTKPELEILADDVKCSHGATIGKLNEDQLFYLEARGLSKEQAQQILIHAFINDMLLRLDEMTRAIVEKVIVKPFYK